MVLVAVLTPLMAVALAVAVAAMLPSRYLSTLVLMLMASFGVWFFRRGGRNHDAERPLAEDDDPELFAVVDRLCTMADTPRPEIVLSDQRQPKRANRRDDPTNPHPFLLCNYPRAPER